MADSGDLVDININFHSHSSLHHDRNSTCCVYLGEVLYYEVLINKPKEADFKAWKRRISHLSAHACVAVASGERLQRGDRNSSSKYTGDENIKSDACAKKSDEVVCSVIATYIDAVEKKPFHSRAESFQNDKLYFRDSNTCVIPMSTCFWNTPGRCHRVELCVTLWLAAPLRKQNPEMESQKDFQLTISSPSHLASSSRKSMEQKSVTKMLYVRDPPHLKVRFVSCGQQHLLLVQVKNATKQMIMIKNMTIVPSSSPSCDHQEFFRDNFPHKEHRGRAESWQQLVSVTLSGGSVFPAILAACEEMALIYRLDLSSVSSEVELAFHSYLRWSHSETNKEINTVYQLPRLRVRYPAFTVTVKCEGPVETGKTFYLTYNIANDLQDFLSVRLYWNLDSQLALMNGDPELEVEKQKLEAVKRAIICHDPDIFIGSCPRGSTLPVSVGFQILQPGLYEFGELMKLNLRWALPDSQSTLKQDSVGTPASSDTVSTLSADDQLLASTELWRDRSGSTCSLHTPTSHSAEERRKTFATKSYSFGDLGPTLSADSDDACRLRFKSIKRSTAVMPPPRPPPPGNLGQPEKDMTNRNNFLKKSFKIYIPSGC